MEKFLSFLKTHTEPGLSYGSTFLDAEPSSTFLVGAGLLLLYLWYLILKPVLPSLGRTKDIRKPQGRAKKRRKPTFKDHRTWQREADDVRKLLSIVRSHPDQPYDPTGFRRLFCPDPCCGCCTSVTAKVSRLLSQASLEDDDSCLCGWASTAAEMETSLPRSCTPMASPHGDPVPAPASESSIPSPSTVSPNELAPLEDFISATSLGNAVPPASVSPLNSKFPVGHMPLHQPSSFLPPKQHSTDPVVQRQAVRSMVCRPSELATDVPTAKDNDRALCTISKPSQQQTSAHNLQPSNSVQSITQRLPEIHSLESFLGDETTAFPVEKANHSSTNPGDVPPLQRQGHRQEYFLSSDGNILIPESLRKPLSISGTASGSDADPQDSAVPHPLGNSGEKPEEIPVHQQSPDPKASEEQEENDHRELFLGHASLHSESLITCGAGDSSERSTFSNRISDSPVLICPTPLSSAKSQPQSLPPSLTPPQFEQVPPAETKVQPKSPVPEMPSSPVSQYRYCEVSLHSSKDEAMPLMPPQIHRLEYNILKKEQEKVCGLLSVVKSSPEEFCPPAPKLTRGEKFSQAHVPRASPPVDWPLPSELRKEMEHHLQKRLIQQSWGLPKRVLESWSQMGFHMRLLVSSESRSSYRESTRKTVRVLKGTLGLQDPKTPNCEKQSSNELNFKSEGRQSTQAQGPSNKMSLASEEFSYKPLITHEQSPARGDVADCPVLRGLLPPGGSSTEHGKEASWAPARALGSCIKQSSPAAHRKFPQLGKTRELGGGDTGLEPCQPPGEMPTPQHRPPGATRGSKSSPSLSKKGQPSPETSGRRQIKHFLQWLCPGRTCKGSRRSPEKSTLATSLQGTGHVKGSAAFPAHGLGKRAPSSTEKVLKEERQLMRVTGNPTRPPGSPPPVMSGRPQHKQECQIQAEPVLSHRLHYQGASSKGTPTKSYSQASPLTGKPTQTGHRNRQSPKCVALQEKPLCHTSPPILAKQGAGTPTKFHL